MIYDKVIFYFCRMKNVIILVPESSVIQAIADPQYLFTSINQFLRVAGKEELFKVQLAAEKKETKLNSGLYSVTADVLIEDVVDPDLIIIPALFGNMKMAVEQNKGLKSWIVEKYYGGSEVASLCVGAFLLASTGLLNHRKCSTHWGFGIEFSEMFPEVELTDGSIITEDSGIYSSGGANSYWNLLLHLVEKYTNRETAILASKYFAIDLDRDSQSSFAIFRGQKDHNDKDVLKVQEFVEENYSDKLSVDELADRFAIGRRSLERRFKKATNNSILEYIQRIKIEAAKRSFESSRSNISEVMFDVGYTDTKAFRTIFKKITGLTPVEYRNKYSKISIE